MTNPRVGIGVIVYNEKEEILLGKRLGAHGQNTWSFPGGHLEYGEDLKECAQRELHEETAINAGDMSFLGVTNNVFENGKHYVTLFFGTTLPKNQQPINCEPHKCEGWEWFKSNELPSPLFTSVQSFFDGGLIATML